MGLINSTKTRKKMIKLNSIKANPNNPRIIKNEKFDKLKRSIEEFPEMMELRPIVIDETNTIIGGNMRFRALQELGKKEVPNNWIKKASELTEDQKNRFVITDNASFGEWEWEAIKSDWDLDFVADWGVDIPEFEAEKAEAKEDNYEIPDEIKTDIVLGDLFEIGVHRLLCGDSTKAENFENITKGEVVDMVFTDPPYDMDMGGQGCFASGMQNLKNRIEDIIHFDPYVIEHFPKYNIRTFYICTSKDAIPKYLDIFKGYNFNILVWCKTNPTPFTSGTFLPDIEYIMFFSRKGDKIWNNSLTPMDTYKKYYISNKLEGREGEGDLHPTMKPIGLIQGKILISSNEGGIVFDFFLGSGTTMVAAHQLNRKCYGMELDPKYCQVIVDRMLNLDPSLKVLKNGKPYAHPGR